MDELPNQNRRQERSCRFPFGSVGLLVLLCLASTGAMAQPLDSALAAQQGEIWKVFSTQAGKFNDLNISYTQTYTSGNRPVKCRVFVSPEGVLAESDVWVLAITPTRAFALSKIRGRYSLLGVEDYQGEEGARAKVRQVAGHFGGSGKALLPFEATGRLALLSPIVTVGVTVVASPQSTHLTGIRKEAGGRTVVTYKVPRPPGVDRLPQGRAVDVDGTLVLDKALGYAVVNHEMRVASSRSNRVEKETIRYHVPMVDLGLPLMRSFEQITTNGEGKKPNQIKVEYGDFRVETLDPARLNLDHYHLEPPDKPFRFWWPVGLAGGGVLVAGFLVYRRIVARKRLQP
jgi:hypothetical protein